MFPFDDVIMTMQHIYTWLLIEFINNITEFEGLPPATEPDTTYLQIWHGIPSIHTHRRNIVTLLEFFFVLRHVHVVCLLMYLLSNGSLKLDTEEMFQEKFI